MSDVNENESCCEEGCFGNDVNLVGSLFIEVRNGEILSAGYITGKFKGKDLYSVSLVDIDNVDDDKIDEEAGFERLVPLEMFVMKDFRIYEDEAFEVWRKHLVTLVKEKRKLVEDRKKSVENIKKNTNQEEK